MQMANPHRQRQQNGNTLPQQWQSPDAAFRRRRLYEDSLFFNFAFPISDLRPGFPVFTYIFFCYYSLQRNNTERNYCTYYRLSILSIRGKP